MDTAVVHLPPPNVADVADVVASDVCVVSLVDRDVVVSIKSRLLYLSEMQLSNIDALKILQTVADNNLDDHVYKLDLSKNNITSSGLSSMSTIFKTRFRHVVDLDLSDNCIGNAGVSILYSIQRERLKLKTLVLSNLNLSHTSITTDGAQILHKMIRKSFGVLNIIFSKNEINGEGVGYLFSAKYWESFTIDNNALDVTYMFFAKHVKSHSYMLKELRILNNNLSPTTIKQLPSLISSLALPSLKYFYLGERSWDAGICAIFDDSAIDNLKNLEYLTFSETYMKEKGYISFLKAFQRNQFPRLIEFTTREENCFTGVTFCKQENNRNIIWKIEYHMLDDTDYTPLLLTTFCIESLTHLVLFCNKNSNIIRGAFEAAQRGFLPNLINLEVHNLLFSFSDIKIAPNFILPKLRYFEMDVISILHHMPVMKAWSIDMYEDILYPAGSHPIQEMSDNQSLEKVTLSETTLCDTIFEVLVFPLSYRAKSIDIRKNAITDYGIKYYADRIFDSNITNVKELLLDDENLSERSKLLIYKITHMGDKLADKKLAEYDATHLPEKEAESYINNIVLDFEDTKGETNATDFILSEIIAVTDEKLEVKQRRSCCEVL